MLAVFLSAGIVFLLAWSVSLALPKPYDSGNLFPVISAFLFGIFFGFAQNLLKLEHKLHSIFLHLSIYAIGTAILGFAIKYFFIACYMHYWATGGDQFCISPFAYIRGDFSGIKNYSVDGIELISGGVKTDVARRLDIFDNMKILIIPAAVGTLAFKISALLRPKDA